MQISQEAGKVVWYSQLIKNFPQFVAIHKVKGFGLVIEAEVDVFLELSCFFDDPVDDGNLIPYFSVFSKTSLNIWKFMVHVLLKPGLENFEHYFASMWNASLDEPQAEIKIARNINNLRYADNITLMAESEEELKSLLMKVKEKSEKVGLKLKNQKTK